MKIIGDPRMNYSHEQLRQEDRECYARLKAEPCAGCGVPGGDENFGNIYTRDVPGGLCEVKYCRDCHLYPAGVDDERVVAFLDARPLEWGWRLMVTHEMMARAACGDT